MNKQEQMQKARAHLGGEARWFEGFSIDQCIEAHWDEVEEQGQDEEKEEVCQECEGTTWLWNGGRCHCAL